MTAPWTPAAPIGGVQGDLADWRRGRPIRPKAPNFVDTGLRSDGTIDPMVQAKALRQCADRPCCRSTSASCNATKRSCSTSATRIGLMAGQPGIRRRHGQVRISPTNSKSMTAATATRSRNGLRSKVLPFFAAHLDK